MNTPTTTNLSINLPNFGHHKNTVQHHPSQFSKKINFNKSYNRRSACYTTRHRHKKDTHNFYRTKKHNTKIRKKVSTLLNQDKYITNLSSRSLTEAESSLLSKGLTYVPTSTPKEASIEESLDNFDRSNRIKYFFRGQPERKPHPFKEPSTWMPPKASKGIETYLHRIRTNLHKVNINKHIKPNLNPQEKKALTTLAKDPNIIIKSADKGSGIVVEDTKNYVRDGEEHLANTTIYRQCQSDPTTQLASAINNYIQNIHTKGIIDSETKNFLMFKDKPPRTQQMYFLKKIHKDPISVRPIVSGCGGPTEKISQFIDHHIQPFVPKIKSYLRDSKHLIQILENKPFPKRCTLVTIDVKTLYLNIPHDEGIQAVLNRVYYKNKDSQNMKIPPETMKDLLKIVLTQNFFQFSDKIYHQIMGVAMGTKLAPSYANLFMAELEEQLLNCLPLDPLLWKRYIDDIFCVLPGTPEDASQLMHTINTKHPTIKFTMESSTTQVDFLDLTIHKGKRFTTTGKFDIKPYFKKTNKFQYLEFSSSHPRNTFSSLIKGEMTRLLRSCSDESVYKEIQLKMYHIFRDRGYPSKMIKDIQESIPYSNRPTILQDKQKEKAQNDTFLIMDYTPHIKPSTIKEILKPTPEETGKVPKPCLGFRRTKKPGKHFSQS